MALRLRRGTDAERQLITPAEGELIYTIDTKSVYIGDGTTVGGNRISGSTDGSPAQLTQNLNLNSNDITGTGNININGITSANTFVGDLTGSVFGDDSTILVDSVNSIITSQSYKSSNNTFTFGNLDEGVESKISIESTDNRGRLDLIRSSNLDLSGLDTINYGSILFSRKDINGAAITSIIAGRENSLLFSSTATSSFSDPTNYFAFKEKKFGIGTITPTQALDVRGNAIISGEIEAAAFKGSVVADDSTTIIDGINGSISSPSYVQFGSLTTIERNALTAANGMVIYNITDNKFQGYENGAWINLV